MARSKHRDRRKGLIPTRRTQRRNAHCLCIPRGLATIQHERRPRPPGTTSRRCRLQRTAVDFWSRLVLRWNTGGECGRTLIARALRRPVSETGTDRIGVTVQTPSRPGFGGTDRTRSARSHRVKCTCTHRMGRRHLPPIATGRRRSTGAPCRHPSRCCQATASNGIRGSRWAPRSRVGSCLRMGRRLRTRS